MLARITEHLHSHRTCPPQEAKCSPYARFFLLKFAISFDGRGDIKGHSKRQVQRIISLGNNTFDRTVQELVELGLMEVHRKAGANSRNALKITVPDHVLNDIYNDVVDLPHGQLIKKILIDQGDELSKRQHQLTVPQRLLLIALLELSDEGGCILGRGQADLEKLTGLNKRQVKNQTRLLLSFRYIRQHSPGAYSPWLIGRFASSYLLNLGHPGYAYNKPEIAIFLFNLLGSHQESLINSIGFIKREIDRYYGRMNYDKDTISGLLEIPETKKIKPSLTTLNHLHWIIFTLATKVLNIELNDTLSMSKDDHYRYIENEIHRTLIPGNIHDSHKKLAIVPITHLRNMVYSLAIEIKELLKTSGLNTTNHGKKHVQILPPDFNLLQKYPCDNFRTPVAICFIDRSLPRRDQPPTMDSEVSHERFSNLVDQYELDEQTLTRAGLATPPLRTPLLPKPPKRPEPEQPLLGK